MNGIETSPQYLIFQIDWSLVSMNYLLSMNYQWANLTRKLLDNSKITLVLGYHMVQIHNNFIFICKSPLFQSNRKAFLFKISRFTKNIGELFSAFLGVIFPITNFPLKMKCNHQLSSYKFQKLPVKGSWRHMICNALFSRSVRGKESRLKISLTQVNENKSSFNLCKNINTLLY